MRMVVRSSGAVGHTAKMYLVSMQNTDMKLWLQQYNLIAANWIPCCRVNTLPQLLFFPGKLAAS